MNDLAEAQLHSAFKEIVYFFIKGARSCVFAGSFFAVLALSKLIDTQALFGLYRYDAILLATLVIQAILIVSKIETWQEIRAITLFHLLGFALEVFKTHPQINSWSYPEPGVYKLFNVPLYAGFMHAAVASCVMQAWRVYQVRWSKAPDAWQQISIASLLYLNFFTHHFVLLDIRWGLALLLLWIYRNTWLHLTAWRTRLRMPMVLGFMMIGFLVWIAENLGSFLGAWQYAYQRSGWEMVRFNKFGAWTLLVVMTFVIVRFSGAVDTREEGT